MFVNLQFVHVHFNLIGFIMLSCSLSLIIIYQTFPDYFIRYTAYFRSEFKPTGFRDTHRLTDVEKNKDFGKTSSWHKYIILKIRFSR